MCLVQDDRLGVGQELDEPLLLHRQVGQQQVMVDDDQVRLLCRTARLDNMTLRVLGTLLPQAVVHGRSDQRPDRGILRDLDQFGAVTALRSMAPLADVIEIIAKRWRNIGDLRESMQAEIIGTALQQRRFNRSADCLADQRQIAMVELILQRFGAGADDRLATAQQGRQQISEGLARAGARLNDELVTVGDGLGNGLRHPCLSGARLEAGQQRLQGAVLTKKFLEIRHGRKITPFNPLWRDRFCRFCTR